jgi:hypothetical protein
VVFVLGRRLTKEERERYKPLIERVKAEYRRRRGSLCGFCGQPFNHLETREYIDSEGELKVYLICVHRTPDGRRVAHTCGANKYTYVSKSHQAIGLTLSNVLDEDQWVNYIINIVETMVARVTSDPEGARLKPKVVEGLRRVKAAVEEGLRELGVVVECQSR